MLDPAVEALVDRAITGDALTKDEAISLLALDTCSPEVAYVLWGAQEIGREAAHNTGQIYAQIGIDANPCPENCAFCMLAAHNSPTREPRELADDLIVGYASTFDRAQVHLISLMTTAGFDFDRFLTIVHMVREAISPDMPLMANIGDIDNRQAQALRSAGVQAAYHAHRLGEGRITGIDPLRRLATFDALQTAGLKLMSAVEPVYEGIDPISIVERMFEVIDLKPYCAGVGALTIVQDATMASCVPISRKRAAFLAAVMRLGAGHTIPFGTGAGNVVWTDAGTNPRGRDLPTDSAYLVRDVSRLRKKLIDDEWQVPARPLAQWFNDATSL